LPYSLTPAKAARPSCESIPSSPPLLSDDPAKSVDTDDLDVIWELGKVVTPNGKALALFVYSVGLFIFVLLSLAVTMI
jgi:hypothetical protein